MPRPIIFLSGSYGKGEIQKQIFNFHVVLNWVHFTWNQWLISRQKYPEVRCLAGRQIWLSSWRIKAELTYQHGRWSIEEVPTTDGISASRSRDISQVDSGLFMEVDEEGESTVRHHFKCRESQKWEIWGQGSLLYFPQCIYLLVYIRDGNVTFCYSTFVMARLIFFLFYYYSFPSPTVSLFGRSAVGGRSDPRHNLVATVDSVWATVSCPVCTRTGSCRSSVE